MQRDYFSSSVLSICAAGMLVAATALPVCAAGTKPQPTAVPPGRQIIDDVPQPLPPRQPPTEAQRERLDAMALFAAGRTHERREEYAAALRCYQRALRCDPHSAAVARAIVLVAIRLRHSAEAVRYALKVAELDDADPTLLRRLGAYLAEEGDWPRAVAFYEKALAASGKAKETAADILLRMEMGRIYHLMEKYPQAAESFARVLYAIDHPGAFSLDEQLTKALLGEQGSTYQLIGECFLAAGRTQEALTAFTKADLVVPNKMLLQFNLARVHVKTGKFAEALAALEASLAGGLSGQGALPYETLGDALAGLGQKNQLLERLEKLRAAEPNNQPLGYYLAAQYRAAGKLDQAESLYLALLKDRPALAGYRSLIEMNRQRNRGDALLNVLGEALEKISALDILAAEAQTISGNADLMRAIVDAARQKMKSQPEKFSFGMRLATALLALEAKQYETAGEFFNLALAAVNSTQKGQGATPAAPKAGDANVAPSAAGTPPSRAAEVLMVWGVGLLMGDRAAEAAKVFQRGIDEKALPESNPVFYFYLAGALALSNQPDAALAAARTAADKNKNSARFRARAAWVLYIAKRYDEAQKAYNDLIREFNADYASAETRAVLRDARLALSNLAVLRGDMNQAEDWLEQVLDEFPDDEGALNDLGYLWADQNKHLERAKRMIEKAVAAEPQNAAFRDSLGWVLFRLEKHAEAVVELEKAAAVKKPDPIVLEHLGDACQKAGRRDKAVEAWRKAAATFRQDKETQKAAAVEKKLLQIAN